MIYLRPISGWRLRFPGGGKSSRHAHDGLLRALDGVLRMLEVAQLGLNGIRRVLNDGRRMLEVAAVVLDGERRVLDDKGLLLL